MYHLKSLKMVRKGLSVKNHYWGVLFLSFFIRLKKN